MLTGLINALLLLNNKINNYVDENFLDHMARTAPTYLFINRRGAIDWNLCPCCVSKTIEESSKII